MLLRLLVLLLVLLWLVLLVLMLLVLLLVLLLLVLLWLVLLVLKLLVLLLFPLLLDEPLPFLPLMLFIEIHCASRRNQNSFTRPRVKIGSAGKARTSEYFQVLGIEKETLACLLYPWSWARPGWVHGRALMIFV